MIFFIFDSLALFISLAVVVVQTSIVVVERRAKKANDGDYQQANVVGLCFVSVAFLALSYIVIGKDERWMASAVTFMGTFIMVATLGTLCYWVVMHRIESSNLRSQRKSARSSKTLSRSVSIMSESEIPEDQYKKLYAI